MVSWLPHILIPGLVALAFFRGLPRRWVMALAPLVWVPDLDYLSPGAHRVLTHNVWIPLALLALALATWRASPAGKAGVPFWTAVRSPGWALGYLLAAYYWGSHVFLDVFAGGVLLFWPLSDLGFYAHYEIDVNLQTGEVQPEAEAGAVPGAPELSTDYAWLNFEHTAALAFLAVVALGALGAWLARRRRSRDPTGKGKTGARIET